MNRSISILVIIIFTVGCSYVPTEGGQNLRRPAVSGSFYPSDPVKLKKTCEGFIKNAHVKSAKGKITGLIVPHAGYMYSGMTAGRGFSFLKNKRFSTVILIGSSHSKFLEKPALCSFKEWQTPLGKVKLDNKLFNEIANNNWNMINNNVFVNEHSLEVELPFLQTALKGEFRILPVLINEYKIEKIRKYSKALSEILKSRKDILIVMSTDMSHYFPAKKAVGMDDNINREITEYDLEGLEKILNTGKGQLCGSGGVMLGMMTLKELGAAGAVQIDYTHSGMVSKDNSRVVGYGSFYIYKQKKSGKEKTMEYDTNQRKKLLKIARDTMENYIKTGKKIEIEVEDPKLREKRGVFVTLHENGRLRGCIGNIMPVDELCSGIHEMAIQSSTRDPRFPSVKENELENIEIEISVLTVPKKVSDAKEIVMGRDGVIVKKGFRQGVYLPQVATETGWSREEFLSSLCYSKAGIEPDSWRDGSAELYTFQAEVFNEKELGIVHK